MIPIPAVADADGALTPFGNAMAEKYARAVLAGDDAARRKLRTTMEARSEFGPVLRVANDIDRDPALAAYIAHG